MQAKFIVSLWQAIKKLNCMWDHSGHYPVQYLENIGQAMEQSDDLILVTGPDMLREFKSYHYH